MKEARLYRKLKNNLVQCQACRWHCTIPDGQTGICGVRYNKGGTLYLTVYGQAVGLHADPIEKKPLYHFLPGTQALSFGTVGCSFGCLFCQNYFQSQPPREIRSLRTSAEERLKLLKQVTHQESTPASPKEIVKLAEEYHLPAIAYTYNEPTVFIEYAYDTAKLAHQKKIKNVFVSNGFESVESLNYISPYLDAINIDLKSFNEDFYRKIVKGRLKDVLENIKLVYQKHIHLEITTLIIPHHNDEPEELKQIAHFIANIDSDIPWHVTAFYPAYKMLDTPPTPPETLLQAWEIGKKEGLNYVYIGNILDPEHSSTYCPKCHSLLIKRQGWRTEVVNLDLKTGRCRQCGYQIKGVWQ